MNNIYGIICANYTANDFGPLLAKRSLSSLPFGGRYRMIDFPLSNMVNAGISTIGVLMPFFYRSLIDHIGTGKVWNLDRKTNGMFTLPSSGFSAEVKGYRISIADLIENHRFLERRKDDSVAVLMSTSRIYNVDLQQIITEHKKSGNSVTFGYSKYKNKKEQNMNLTVINHDVLVKLVDDYATKPYMLLVDCIEKDIAPNKIGTYTYNCYMSDINNAKDYVAANMDLLDQSVQKELFNPERTIYTKIQDEAPALFKKGSSVNNSLVSAGCIIEGEVENCILFRNVVVEKGAKLKNCVVMQHCVISEKAKLSNIILDKYAKVRKGDVLEAGSGHPLIIGKDTTL